jgi:hypothetical protein
MDEDDDLTSRIHTPIIVVPPLWHADTEAREDQGSRDLHLTAQQVGKWDIIASQEELAGTAISFEHQRASVDGSSAAKRHRLQVPSRACWP